MHLSLYKLAAVLAVLASTFVLVACGESAEEKAKAQVCAARADIAKQVQKLGGLTLSLNIFSEAKTSLEAIGGDITKIKDAQPALEPARKEQLEKATRSFETQINALLSELSSKPSLNKIEDELKSAPKQLLSEYEKALLVANCK